MREPTPAEDRNERLPLGCGRSSAPTFLSKLGARTCRTLATSRFFGDVPVRDLAPRRDELILSTTVDKLIGPGLHQRGFAQVIARFTGPGLARLGHRLHEVQGRGERHADGRPGHLHARRVRGDHGLSRRL